jgi:hypothetical protein
MRVQFNGLKTSGAVLVGAMLVSGGLMFAGASDVSAPEPARLNASLYGNGSAASATYTQSQLPTTAVQWPGSWAVGNIPAGTPCATYAVPAGVTLTSIIYAQGSYRKCF